MKISNTGSVLTSSPDLVFHIILGPYLGIYLAGVFVSDEFHSMDTGALVSNTAILNAGAAIKKELFF